MFLILSCFCVYNIFKWILVDIIPLWPIYMLWLGIFSLLLTRYCSKCLVGLWLLSRYFLSGQYLFSSSIFRFSGIWASLHTFAMVVVVMFWRSISAGGHKNRLCGCWINNSILLSEIFACKYSDNSGQFITSFYLFHWGFCWEGIFVYLW